MKFPSTIRFKWAVTGTLVAAAADVVTTVAVAGDGRPGAGTPHAGLRTHHGRMERSNGPSGSRPSGMSEPVSTACTERLAPGPGQDHPRRNRPVHFGTPPGPGRASGSGAVAGLSQHPRDHGLHRYIRRRTEHAVLPHGPLTPAPPEHQGRVPARGRIARTSLPHHLGSHRSHARCLAQTGTPPAGRESRCR